MNMLTNESPLAILDEALSDGPETPFSTQLRIIQQADEDYEWYPTTNEILERMTDCLINVKKRRGPVHRGHLPHRRNRLDSFLDIGAGNGKVLDFVKAKRWSGPYGNEPGPLMSDFYAIEKSQTHLSNLDASYYILGVDFHKLTLLDKEIDVIFCNPPYSEYEQWATKIIREAPTGSVIYLVIPERWKNSRRIQDELAVRMIKEAKVKGSFDFESAEDRTARAKVDLLEIDTAEVEKHAWREGSPDPFERFFDENFTYPEQASEEADDGLTDSFKDQVERQKIVHRGNLIEALAFLYEDRMQSLHTNYAAICSLDREILAEFEIQKGGLMKSLKMKLETAKKQYWQRLFDGMDKINERLTFSSRESIVRKMQAHTGIEFNRENAYAVVLWVIKNANHYFDDQLVKTYEKLVSFANVEAYASNKRVFKKNEFSYRYRRDYGAEGPSHYHIRVGHRIVLEDCGGIVTEYGTNKGLRKDGCNIVNDLLTVGNNLGFEPLNWGPPGDGWKNDWQDSEPRVFACKYKGETHTLMRVRAFHNGNMHFQFLPEFIHALNIQHGKLKGWLHTAEEAERETGAPKAIANELIDYRFRIESEQLYLQ